ncbi:hypothetical protein GWK08_11580 [Leptobacterium flavescens]|uniref:Lysoplasmalogenase n=1 Tax=Leptobacterium flavescens TaxID=472055 RepID=A0A6P0ULI1_9FLAO|nr:hypothetical protein [Leptobacterium flavescens]
MKIKKAYIFNIIFLTILLTDIVFHSIEYLIPYRDLTKPLIALSLMFFYYKNSKNKPKKERRLMMMALLMVLVGSGFLLEGFGVRFYFVGLMAYFMANIVYSSLLYRSAHFDVDRSIPFLIVACLYLMAIYYFIYDNLGGYLIPTLFYFFTVLNLTQSAYLRYKIVNNKSYYLVLAGTVLFMVSESIWALTTFYKSVPFGNIWMMFFYGISQLLIVHGVLVENKKFRRF